MIEVDAYNNRKFKGVVTQISSTSRGTGGTTITTSNDVTNYEVRIRLDPASYSDLMDPNKTNSFPFRPGMSASADIMTRKQQNVLSVPVLALTTRDKNEKAEKEKEKGESTNEQTEVNLEDMEEVLFVVENGKVKKTSVKTGIQDNDYIEIVSGIKAGAEVVSALYDTISKVLKEGMEVEVVSIEKIYSKD